MSFRFRACLRATVTFPFRARRTARTAATVVYLRALVVRQEQNSLDLVGPGSRLAMHSASTLSGSNGFHCRRLIQPGRSAVFEYGHAPQRSRRAP